MNKFFTLTKHAIVCFIATTLATTAFAADSTGNFSLNFSSTPTLLSGQQNKIGSKYRFNNVTPGRAAIVTIVAATGNATVDMLDDNNLTKPEAFSPRITIPANKTGMVEFKIELVDSLTGVAKMMDTLYATAMDIDGSGSLREMDAINLGGGTVSYQGSPLQISVTQTGTEFLGKNIGGVEYPDVDTSAKVVMFTVTNRNVATFTYRAGAENGGNSSVTRQKGIYFKGFVYTAPVFGPLPITLNQFSGISRNGNNILSWETSNELNSKSFVVEKSLDGRSYSSIGEISAAGYSTASKAYTLTDYNVKANISYYRLRMVDKDGSFAYSNIVVLKQEATVGTISLFPSPATDFTIVSISTTEAENITLRMVNKEGKVLLTRNEKVASGTTNIRLGQLDQYAAGTYYLQVVQANKTTTKPFVIL